MVDKCKALAIPPHCPDLCIDTRLRLWDRRAHHEGNIMQMKKGFGVFVLIVGLLMISAVSILYRSQTLPDADRIRIHAEGEHGDLIAECGMKVMGSSWSRGWPKRIARVQLRCVVSNHFPHPIKAYLKEPVRSGWISRL